MVSKMNQKIIKIFFLGLFLFSAKDNLSYAQENSLDQSADQDQGQYRSMDMSYAGFGSIGMMQSAWLDPLQNLGEGQTKPAYSKYYWSPDLVLPVRLREGMITMINFPEWEMVEDVYIGDNSTFDGQISGPSTVLLYPKKGANVGVDTNVIIFGRSGNRYVFYVRSEGVNTERLTNSIIDIDVIGSEEGVGSFGGGGSSISNGGKGASGYGNSNPKSVASTYTRRFQKEDWLKSIPVNPEKFRFDIEVYVPNPEDVIIAPERVWRDDIFTYIDLGNKALNMNQRPIVTLINEKVETPVGFRSKGPNNRLIVVEAIGDMVLRNGKRIVCLKLRRSDDAGLENGVYADDIQPGWDVPPPLKNGDLSAAFDNATPQGVGVGNVNGVWNSAPQNMQEQGQYIYPQYGNNAAANMNGANYGYMAGQNVMNPQAGMNVMNPQAGMNVMNPQVGMNGGSMAYPQHQGAVTGKYDYSKMQKLPNQTIANQNNGNSKYLQQFGYGSGFDSNTNISIELGTDDNVSQLETLWDNLSGKYKADLAGYEPFYSVDTPADGQGKELFHLRVGPVKSLEEGDAVCSKLGRNGIFCSVVRTQ